MAKKYPENIEDLENFYQKEFSDFSSEPSAELWGKIQATLPKNHVGSTSEGFFKKNYKWIGGTFFSGFVILAVVYIWERKEVKTIEMEPLNKQEIIKSTEKESITIPAENTKEIPVLKETINEKNSSKKQPKANPFVESKETKKEEIKTVPKEEVIPVIAPEPPIKEEVKEAKKPQSFYEKYSKLKKDSVRDLFVPDKK